ncbi:hypothetical protein BC332_24512 [Capsicum chinense]|nr:hypothetical protein BC332_24512 [Capsicum chinense]
MSGKCFFAGKLVKGFCEEIEERFLVSCPLKLSPIASVSDASESFIREDDATQFLNVIHAAEDADVYHDSVKFLLMVRQKTKENSPRLTMKSFMPMVRLIDWVILKNSF